MDFSDRFRHKDYNQFQYNRYNNRFRPRGRSGGRGRGRGRSSDTRYHTQTDFNPNFESEDFGRTPNSSVTQFPKPKPQYDTLIVELGQSGRHFTEDSLRQLFQQTYGTIKKIYFNTNDNKAFITFYSHISVDMCVESGDTVLMNGHSIKVYPLQVDAPSQLFTSKGDPSFHLKNLCKSNNLSLKANFPSKESIQRQFRCDLPIDRKELLDLVRVSQIDDKKLLDDLLNAKNIDNQFDILVDALELKDSDKEKRFRLKSILEDVLNSNGLQCKLHFFGSTVNGLGFCNSDIDLFIETPDQSKKSFDDSMSLLKKVQTILRKCLKMFVMNPIPSVRCPLLRLDFNQIPSIKNSNSCGLKCDISLSNALAKRNSQLFRLYTQLEPRFHKMCHLLRFWAKTNGFIGSNHMSSYALTHLVLFFFQSQQILPSVDKLRQLCPPKQQIIINDWNCSFDENSDNYESKEKSENSLIELLEKFFDFYANYDFSNLIICTKTGSAKHKSQPSTLMDIDCDEDIKELANDSFKLTPIISIEDPFELTHNLCAHFNYRTFDKFCDYIISISHKFRAIFVDKPNEEPNTAANRSKDPNWGLTYLCREWDPTPNGYIFPENFIGIANSDLILNSENCQMATDLMQTLANHLIDLTDHWLTNVYRIESSLLSKWHLFINYLSPFAEFYIKLRAIDNKTIDPITRQETRQQLTEEDLKGLSFVQIETKVTERIHNSFSVDVENKAVIPVECHFALVMNCRIPFPTVELALINLKPSFESSKTVINFLRRLIAMAANDDRLLTCPTELISQ